MARRGKQLLWLFALGLPLAWMVRAPQNEPPALPVPAALDLPRAEGMTRLAGGEYLRGSPRPGPDDQRPVHRVRLPAFWCDETSVTNRQFAAFVEATSYQTTAEEQGWSLLFDRTAGKWEQAAGVSWRNPTGANSSLVGKDDYPVVHVSWSDAVAYATWAGKRLPSEAEFEFAARGGLSDAEFPWGRQLTPDHRLRANYWQGKFPFTNLNQDGHWGVAPGRSFPANRFGLFDMAGNVGCWCADWYAADAYGSGLAREGRGPESGTERVIRGGSWVSTSDPGGGMRVADRGHAPPTTTSDTVGFRCVRDATKRVK